MVVCDPSTEKAQNDFRALLEADPDGCRQEYEVVLAELKAKGVIFGDKTVPICLAPALISSQRLRPIQQSMQRLTRILEKLQEPLRNSFWLDRLGITPEEQELIMLDPGIAAGGYISRVDGFLGPANGEDTGYRIVELNVDSPGGAAFMDVCVEALRKTSIWKRFKSMHPGKYLASDVRDLKLLLDAYKEWGGVGVPRVAIVDWCTVNTVAEFELVRKSFMEKGVETIVADPRELEFRGGKLLDYDGKPIDLIYRRVLVEDLLAQPEAVQPLLQAFRAGAVCVVNTLACKPLTVKSLLSQIHMDEFEKMPLSRGELQFLRNLIPWTADVEDSPMLDRVRTGKETTILKPADGYGGQGLYLGWEMTQQEWEAAMQEAVQGRYVAQERVFIPQADFPVAGDDGWRYERFRVDFDPYMFGQGMGDPLVRMSTSDILNVKAGAQIAATWILK